MSDAPLVREVDPIDVPAVHALFARLLPEAFAAFPEDGRRHYARQWSRERLARHAADPDALFFGAFAGVEGPVGFVIGTPLEGGVGTVVWLAVAPERRGQGLGRMLLDAATDAYRARGGHKLKLYTHDEDARRFYHRVGLAEEGEHPEHWWGLTFWSLARRLDEPEQDPPAQDSSD